MNDPSVMQPPAPSLEALPLERRRDYLLRALDGSIASVETRLSYRIGIALVMLLMILLPLVYLGLIAACGWSVWYHLEHHTGMLGSGSSARQNFGAFLVHLAPAVGGGILILFMLKPLFSRPARSSEPRALNRDAEPLLFEFVERVCEVVGSPKPRQINVNIDSNAYASLRRGIWSMFGNDLSLTIGLPLMAGTSLRQFSGVLAHEFGHFAQGTGMRATYVIRSVSHWFTRVVYERDRWDRRLEDWSRGIDIRLSWILWLARLGVWATRKILWCLMMIGNGVSGYMLRQMEFDADRYEARFAGSRTFESTSRRLAALMVAHQQAFDNLFELYQEGRLVDDLPRLVVFTADRFTTEQLDKIREFSDGRKAHWFDTHPTDPERIESARRENAPGLFRLKGPASALSADFGRLCRGCSLEFYKESLGEKFQPETIRSFEEMSQRQLEEEAGMQALGRFLRGQYSFLRPWNLDFDASDPASSLDDLKSKFTRARRTVDSLQPEYQKNVGMLYKNDERLVQCSQANAFHRSGMQFPREAFEMDLTNRSRLPQIRSDFEESAINIASSLIPFETSIAEMMAALADGLQHPEFPNRNEQTVRQIAELRRLNAALRSLNAELGSLFRLRMNFASLAILLHQIDGNEHHQPLINAVLEDMKLVTQQLQLLRDQFGGIPYPFEHARGEISIGEFLIEAIPAEDNPGEIYPVAESCIDRALKLRARLLGRMCVILDEVRDALELPPFEEPRATADNMEAN